MSGNYSSVLWISEIDKDDIDNVGKKAVSLGEMNRAGFPVPPAFIVSNHAFQHFLHENNLITRIKALLTTVHYDDVSSLMQISHHIEKMILEATMSPDLIKEIDNAYRKFGGFFQHAEVSVSLSQKSLETHAAHLYVQGETNLLLKIRESWALLFNPTAIRALHQTHTDLFHNGTAIIIQKMVHADFSGTIITQNPITQNKDAMVIEAVYGFSDNKLNPDQYELSKNDLHIIDKKIATQEFMLKREGRETKSVEIHKLHKNEQKLPDNKILDLAVMAKKLEKHTYFPQVITWAIEKNKIYFLNMRQLDLSPHTKSNLNHATPSKHLPLLLKAIPASPGLKKGPVRVIRHAKELVYVQPGDVVVAPSIHAEYMPAFKKAVAIITEQGGHVSQAAHVSRELGIPAVIGAEKASQILHSGVIVTVNGTTGEVFGGATHVIPHNGIHTATKLYVSLTNFDHVESIAKEHVDGVGVLHSDLLLKEFGIHPQKMVNDGQERAYTDKLVRELEKTCKAFAPHPVVFSFSDLLTPELRQLSGGKLYEPIETNPMIGYRGAYRFLHSSKLFSLELQAVKQIRNKGINNIWLIIPFVRTTRELEEIKRILTAAGLQRSPGLRHWLQVTTPANLISLDSYISLGIDGVSIDLDMIISLLLGVDKTNSEIVKEFNPHDPAVLWILEQAVKICHKHHIPISVSGQTTSQYPALLEKFIDWGVTSITVEPNAIHPTRKQILQEERLRIEKGKRN